MLGKTEGRGRRGRQRVSWVASHSVDGSLSGSGDSEGQGGLECCSPWGPKESDRTERLNHSLRSDDPIKSALFIE